MAGEGQGLSYSFVNKTNRRSRARMSVASGLLGSTPSSIHVAGDGDCSSVVFDGVGVLITDCTLQKKTGPAFQSTAVVLRILAEAALFPLCPLSLPSLPSPILHSLCPVSLPVLCSLFPVYWGLWPAERKDFPSDVSCFTTASISLSGSIELLILHAVENLTSPYLSMSWS